MDHDQSKLATIPPRLPLTSEPRFRIKPLYAIGIIVLIGVIGVAATSTHFTSNQVVVKESTPIKDITSKPHFVLTKKTYAYTHKEKINYPDKPNNLAKSAPNPVKKADKPQSQSHKATQPQHKVTPKQVTPKRVASKRVTPKKPKPSTPSTKIVKSNASTPIPSSSYSSVYNPANYYSSSDYYNDEANNYNNTYNPYFNEYANENSTNDSPHVVTRSKMD